MSRHHRLLLIEDDPTRIARIRAWIPSNFVIAEARSAGQAIGFLKRLLPGELSGVMLDHDLQQQTITSADIALSGSSVIPFILQHVGHDIPVLVHSQNPQRAGAMAQQLEKAGYWVTRIPMDRLTQKSFSEWLEELRCV